MKANNEFNKKSKAVARSNPATALCINLDEIILNYSPIFIRSKNLQMYTSTILT
ncbi:hypothetical protein [Clostridium sp.]|uniref:hypothetical protein n=1 Tax=Clostridium sp. TaxID=1506 RepID=UPI00284C1C4D|nr:hypothetical protein [Clostridium sp.]MDR3598139.1 hypothetical protein [Clostridium sp.]